MSTEVPRAYRLGAVLTPPITTQQVAEFKAGTRDPAASTPADSSSNSNNASLGSSVSTGFHGELPRFVLADFSSYYGDIHPDTQLPEGLGIMIFKTDASGIGAAFDGVPPREVHHRSGSNHSCARAFAAAVKARNDLLTTFTTSFTAGDRYGGYWHNGLCDGDGVLITSTFTFQGQFLEGKPHGKGSMRYHRSFVDRMPTLESSEGGGGGVFDNGIGSFLLKGITSVLLAPIPEALMGGGGGGGPNKPKDYIGDYDRVFLRHGMGMMRYANGDVYEGEWQYNRRTGQGKFISEESGEQYIGSWLADERHGYGTINYPDGSFFKGLFDKGIRSGEGLWLFPNGDEYYGNFERNRIQGEGTMKFKNGDVYVGSWRDGMRHGEGKYILKRKGITVKGNFVKGLVEGSGRVEYPNTGVFVGQFERGERRSGSMFWYTREELMALAEEKRKLQRTHPMESRSGVNTGGSEDSHEMRTTAMADGAGAGGLLWSGFNEDPRRCYQGSWVGESMHGKGLMWYKNGDFFSGNFVKNVREGPGNIRYAGGRPSTSDTEGTATNITTTTTTAAANGGVASGENDAVPAPFPAREYSGYFHADRRHGFGIEQSHNGSIKAGRWDNDVFVEGYEGEWDNESFNGVGRLRLTLASFFRQMGDKASAEHLAMMTSASMAAMRAAPPPLGISPPPALSEGNSAIGRTHTHPSGVPGTVGATKTSRDSGNDRHAAEIQAVTTAPTSGADQPTSGHATPEVLSPLRNAQASWQTAVTTALELNDLFMVEFFGTFRNGRRDGSGILKLPFSCEPLPGTVTTSESATAAAAVKAGGGYGRRLFRRSRATRGCADSDGHATGNSSEDLAASKTHEQQAPPTLLVRRHVLKGQWESNVFDCDRGVWSFPSGETYVGAFRRGVREDGKQQQQQQHLREQARSQSESMTASGLLYFPDGSVFQGSWQRDAPTGRGFLLRKDTHNPIYERRLDMIGSAAAARRGAVGATTAPISVQPPSQTPSAERTRHPRYIHTRHVGGDASEGSKENATAEGSQTGVPAHAATTTSGPGLLGLSCTVSPCTGAAESDGKDASGNDDRSAAASKQEERLIKVFTGYEDGYYLFGNWYQETDSAVAPVRYGDPAAGTIAAMPFSEYRRKIFPKTFPPLSTDKRAIAFDNTTMADTAVGLRPPSMELARLLTSVYSSSMKESGSEGNARLIGGAGASITDSGSSDAPGSNSSEAHLESYYTRLLLNTDSTNGADMRPGAMTLPPTPSTLNIARASGEGVYVYPATGVCIQAFFLDGMPRLAVPYRAGSAFDEYLGHVKAHYPMLQSQVSQPSACSDYSYLLNGIPSLRNQEVFSSGVDLVSMGTADARAGARGRGGGAMSVAGDCSDGNRNNQDKHTRAGQAKGLGGSNAFVPGVYAAPTAVTTEAGGVPPSKDAADSLPLPLEAPRDPLPSCTMCGKSYAFFRAAGCCTLCFRSCCSSCLNNYELLRKTSLSSSPTSASSSSSGGSYGYTEVSALLASSYYLLQKLKKGPDAFAATVAPSTSTTTSSSTPIDTTEVTSRQLMMLLSGSAALPVCGDCVRAILMRIEQQVQWIPLRLFSSILKLEEEDQLEMVQARAARAHQRALRRRARRQQKAKQKKRGAAAHEDPSAGAVSRATATASGSALAAPWRCIASEEPIGAWLAAEDPANTPASAATAAATKCREDECLDTAEPEAMRVLAEESEKCASTGAHAVDGDTTTPGARALEREMLSTTPRRNQQHEELEEGRNLPSPAPPYPNSDMSSKATGNNCNDESASDEGFAIYRGYTSHGIPHLYGELWWWPSGRSRAAAGAAVLSYTSRATDTANTETQGNPDGSRVTGASLSSSASHYCTSHEEDNESTGNGESERGATLRSAIQAGQLSRVLDLAAAAGLSSVSRGDRYLRRRQQEGAAHGVSRAHWSRSTPPVMQLTVTDRIFEAMAARAATAAEATVTQAESPSLNETLGFASRTVRVGSGARRSRQQPLRQLRYHYAGSFSAGKRCGHGALTFENGEKYLGFFANNQMNGEGFYFCDDGAVVHGEWRRNQLAAVHYVGELDEATLSRCGRGICFFRTVRAAKSLFFDACTAVGAGVGNKTETPDGIRGTASAPAAATGTAAGVSENAISNQDGMGHAVPGDFLIYNGEWRNGRMHGSGTLHLRGGATYRGTFRCDYMQGTGRLTTPFSDFYGTFRRNAKHGYGVEFFFDVNSNARSKRSHRLQRSRSESTHAAAASITTSMLTVSSVVEGQWSGDVSHGLVRMYMKAKMPVTARTRHTDARRDTSSSASIQASLLCNEEFEIVETTYRSGNERDDCFAAPLMRSDSERTACLLCRKSFQLFVRRHHCRLCGELVCDACSQKRARLPSHFYASEEEKMQYQREARMATTMVAARARDAAAVAAAASSSIDAAAFPTGVEQINVFPTGSDPSNPLEGRSASDDDEGGAGQSLDPATATATAAAASASASGATAATTAADEANAVPQRVCDICFFRLEQRRQLVIHKYADHSVYCGCSCRGRWVSRGLYWRADGLFFIFDDRGKLLERPKAQGERDACGSDLTAATVLPGGLGASGNKSYAFSSSVLQDAALTKEFLDNNPVIFSESSPTAELDRFLRWWISINTRCMLSLGSLDLPQLRAYMTLSALTRASVNAARGFGSSNSKAAAVVGGSSSSPSTSMSSVGDSSSAAGSVRVILAGTPEAHALSVENLLPSVAHKGAPLFSREARVRRAEAEVEDLPTTAATDADGKDEVITPSVSLSRPTNTKLEEQRGQATLAVDPLALGIDVDFQRWVQFPHPPPAPLAARFLSSSDANRLKRHLCEETAMDTTDNRSADDGCGKDGMKANKDMGEMRSTARDVEAALLRAERYRPALLPRPPPYPIIRNSSTTTTTTNDAAGQAGLSGGEGAQEQVVSAATRTGSCSNSDSDSSEKSRHYTGLSALGFAFPPPLAAVDMNDEELLRAVAKERVEGFMPFLPPSQLDDRSKDGNGTVTETAANVNASNSAAMKILACYNYQPLFPPTPAVPVLRTDRAVPWNHWQVRDIPVFNPSRLPLVRRAQTEGDLLPSRGGATGSATAQTEINSAHTSPFGNAGETFDENALFYGCPFNPVVVSNSNEVVESGKIRKVAELMVTRERRSLRRHQRQQLRLQRRRVQQEERERRRLAAGKGPAVKTLTPHDSSAGDGANAASSSSCASSTSFPSATSPSTDDDDLSDVERAGLSSRAAAMAASDVSDAESIGGHTALSLVSVAAALGGVSAGDAASDGAGALDRNARKARSARLRKQREQHQEQISALLTMSRNDKAWLPEHFGGPFKFSLHCRDL